MATVTLAELREKVRARLKRGEFTDNSSTKLAEVNDLINEARQAFNAMLAGFYGDNYFMKRVALTTTPNVSTVDLPVDFFKLKKLYWVREPGNPPLIEDIERANVDSLRTTEWVRPWQQQLPKHTLGKDTITFGPTPSEAYSVVLWYVPEEPDLVADGDDMYVGPGWDQWIVLEVCIRIAGESEKRDSDFARFTAAQAKVEARIQAQAPDRNETDALQMRNARRGTRGMGDQERRDAVTNDPRYWR